MLTDGDINYVFSLVGAKLVVKLANIFKKGATALPGYFVEKINPSFLSTIRSQIDNCILVTGTNGKTTTTRLIFHFLSKENKLVANNYSGSNLKRGIIASIIPHLRINKTLSKKFDFFIFECDEFAISKVANELNIKYIVMLNLFRDQLDRYGEIDTIRERWLSLIESNKNIHYIINADDPSLTSLFFKKNVNVSYFGLQNYTEFSGDNLSDVLFCPICGSMLYYHQRFFSHLGDYYCDNCGFKRPNVDLSGELMDSKNIIINHLGESYRISMPIKGDYNIYNLLASTLIYVELGFKIENLSKSITDFKTTFGRYELLHFNGKRIFLILVKNPVGFTQALFSTIGDNKKNFIFLLNDNIADGRDVSWIWDVNFDILKTKINTLMLGGTRMYDLGLRIKYSDIEAIDFNFVKNYKDLFNEIKDSSENEYYIFLTYTALLELKQYLSRHGFKNFYEQ